MGRYHLSISNKAKKDLAFLFRSGDKKHSMIIISDFMNEVILEEEEQKLRLLRHALIEGEESGWVENFDPNDFKVKLKEDTLYNE